MKISHQELANWTPSPGTPGDALYQIASGVKDVACSIWNNFPYNWIPTNPVTGLIKGFWNSNCAMPPTNLPPINPPPPPFTGGQCLVTYNVYVRFERSVVLGTPPSHSCITEPDPPLSQPLIPNALQTSVWGEIVSMGLQDSFNTICANGFYNFGVLCHGSASGSRNPNEVVVIKNLTTPAGGTTYTSILEAAVQRIDGNPDNCGDPSTSFPPQPPPGPQNYPITIFDGLTNITLNLNWDGDVNIPLTFAFEGGLINFDFGGISIEWSGDLVLPGGGKNPFPEKPPITLPPGTDPPGGGGTQPKPNDPEVIIKPPVVVDPDNPLDEEPPAEEEIVFIKITVNSIFQNKRYLIQTTIPADDTYFAGYVCFTYSGSTGFSSAPEIPIRRKETLVKFDQDYDGFKVRAINGANLSVETYTVSKNPAKGS